MTTKLRLVTAVVLILTSLTIALPSLAESVEVTSASKDSEDDIRASPLTTFLDFISSYVWSEVQDIDASADDPNHDPELGPELDPLG